ncbi:hypothetical protein ACIP6Q_36375 [Streptomyces bobili]|uniref:hypothetical protein n=1 Tax=Streptomyces bobili TaxID=67280 RepID=UPI00381ED38C
MVTVLFLLAGCADEPRPWEGISGSQVRDLTNEEVVEIERAEQKLIKACMKDKGFPYWEFPVPSVDERKSGNYVIESVRWAKEYGYGREFEKLGENIRTSHRTVIYQNALPKGGRVSYTRALDGNYRDRMTVKLPGKLGKVATPRGGGGGGAPTKHAPHSTPIPQSGTPHAGPWRAPSLFTSRHSSRTNVSRKRSAGGPTA